VREILECFCWFLYSHVVFTLQKRTVTSEFAECDLFLSVRPSFLILILFPLESPCAEASKASMDCLNRHDYDRDKCLDFFQAYRDCKKAWVRPIIRSLFSLPTSRTLIDPRDGTTQGRSSLWKGMNDGMHVKATDIQRERVLLFICMRRIIQPSRAPPPLPSAYSAPRTQDRIRAARELHRRHA